MEDFHDKEERVLTSLKKSRMAFLVEYVCALFLGFLLLMLFWNKIIIPGWMFRGVIVLIVGIVVFAEISRRYTRYVITPSKMVIIKGLINEYRKNIYFHPLAYVPDFEVRQSFGQRMLGYGTVSLSGSQGYDFLIEDVNNPNEVLKVIEDLVNASKDVDKRKK
ncbi:PH domain-containing protein [Candidatus Woesearchaeota archaeon]|nr:PH domain-containing protein [Candidatus Woesearchaeota archaeon]